MPDRSTPTSRPASPRESDRRGSGSDQVMRYEMPGWPQAYGGAWTRKTDSPALIHLCILAARGREPE